jgi:hypothetical protein
MARAEVRPSLVNGLGQEIRLGDGGDLREQDARQVGRGILRDNALALFPQLKDRLGKHKIDELQPAKTGANQLESSGDSMQGGNAK